MECLQKIQDHSSLIPSKSWSKQNIVLDLDNTLVSSYEGDDDLRVLKATGLFNRYECRHLRQIIYQYDIQDIGEYAGLGAVQKGWGIRRPYLNEFLRFCFSRFRSVIIWSAGYSAYVSQIVDKIFRPVDRAPHLVYSSSRCPQENGKPLLNITKFDDSLASIIDLSNTFIVDDRYDNFVQNPDNGILIPAFDAKIPDDCSTYHDDDNCLLSLRRWFLRSEVIDCPDIRILDKTKIFSKE